MTDKYETLCRLQKETAGATFNMGYSTKRNMHYVYVIQKKKRFESRKDLSECIEEAITYITENRVENVHNEIKWTLNEFKF